MVAPGVMRKVITHEDPIRLIAIGGVPGKAYEAPDQTQLGAPDPLEQRN